MKMDVCNIVKRNSKPVSPIYNILIYLHNMIPNNIIDCNKHSVPGTQMEINATTSFFKNKQYLHKYSHYENFSF